MTVAKIVVPVRGDGMGENVLEHALAVGRTFNAHIEAIYCRPRAQDMIPFGVVVPAYLRDQIEASMDTVAGGEGQRLHGLFQEFAKRHGIELVGLSDTPPRDRVTMSWCEVAGKQAEIMGLRGRLADLVVVPKPDRKANLGINTLHSALLNTGRPVMMCAETLPERPLLRHVAVAWNGSTESARAVALGIDLIQKAERVTAFTVGETPHGASVDALKSYLAVRGVALKAETLIERGDIGTTILSATEKAGADLLLMGAYSQSRGQELLFGGVSQYIVNRASLPVVMVH